MFTPKRALLLVSVVAGPLLVKKAVQAALFRFTSTVVRDETHSR